MLVSSCMPRPVFELPEEDVCRYYPCAVSPGSLQDTGSLAGSLSMTEGTNIFVSTSIWRSCSAGTPPDDRASVQVVTTFFPAVSPWHPSCFISSYKQMCTRQGKGSASVSCRSTGCEVMVLRAVRFYQGEPTVTLWSVSIVNRRMPISKKLKNKLTNMRSTWLPCWWATVSSPSFVVGLLLYHIRWCICSHLCLFARTVLGEHWHWAQLIL